MTTPTYCTDCGHELGIGRFCTNCGRPVPGRHPEAKPTVSAPQPGPPMSPPPTVPPHAVDRPPSARYPLYADSPPTVVSPAPTPQPPSAPPFFPGTTYDDAPSRSNRWALWTVAVVLVALVAGVGAFLLVGGDDDRAADDARADQSRSGAPEDSGSDDPEQPDSTGTGAPVDDPEPADVVDLTADVTAKVPGVAPPSRDTRNQPVTFVPANMWDANPRTSWRMAGDATGETLTFDLGSEVVLTDVGMINGYAKVDGPTNWYRSNRRIRAVQWEFDDGTRITQEFADKQTMQMAAIGPVTTRSVKVHLLTVTAPGKGTSGRDFTAISEVRFLGATGG